MELSVLVPWYNRPQLQETLRRNAEHFNDNGCEVIIISGGGELPQLRELIADHGCRTLRVLHVETDSAQGFNKCACLNLGAASAAGDTLFVLDTDVVLTPGCLRACLDVLAEGQCFATIAEVIESDPSSVPPWAGWDAGAFVTRHVMRTELYGANGHRAFFEYNVRKDGVRCGPGLVMVRREHFAAVGGYNSNLVGWGFEDYDLLVRLQLSLGLRHMSCGRVHHLSHPRVSGADQSHGRNVSICHGNYLRGDFAGTQHDDATRWPLIQVPS